MKKYYFLLILGLFFFSNTASSSEYLEPNESLLSDALASRLEQRGDFCLGKFEWPIDVSLEDDTAKTNDAIQMPALEKAGLVSSTNEQVTSKEGETETHLTVKRYVLSDTGKKFYLERESTTTTSSGIKVLHHGDLCPAKLSLSKIVKWEKPFKSGENWETTARYTYKVKAADWANDPDIQKVFPLLSRIIHGEGNMQLQQRFRFSGQAWIAIGPLD